MEGRFLRQVISASGIFMATVSSCVALVLLVAAQNSATTLLTSSRSCMRDGIIGWFCLFPNSLNATKKVISNLASSAGAMLSVSLLTLNALMTMGGWRGNVMSTRKLPTTKTKLRCGLFKVCFCLVWIPCVGYLMSFGLGK